MYYGKKVLTIPQRFDHLFVNDSQILQDASKKYLRAQEKGMPPSLVMMGFLLFIIVVEFFLVLTHASD